MIATEIAALRPAVLRYATSLTQGRDAEDLCHDAILRAIERQAQFRPGTRLEPWVCTIARNLRIDQVRRERCLADIIATLKNNQGFSNGTRRT